MTAPTLKRVLEAMAIAIVLFSFPMVNVEANDRAPNIVLIMADDIGVEGIGCYGSTSYETPNLDRLASKGLRFDHSYSQPLCANTRLQLMTGLHNNRNWICFGILDPTSKTIGHYLKDAGYKSCIAGKWQLQSYDPPDYPGAEKRRGLGMHPKDAGFDQYSLFHSLHTEDKGSRYADPTWLEDGELKYAKGKYGPDIWVNYINDFMEREKDHPFFVYYPMALPHWPMSVTPDCPEWSDPNQRANADTKNFTGMVKYMDKCVGKILQKIDDLGLKENTLVIFYSDNGTHLKVTSQTQTGPVAGGKAQPTNAGTHVPMIASWPGKINPGATDVLVDSCDFIPTLMEAIGKPLPADHDLDGISFFPQMMGKAASKQREWIYSFYDPRPGWDKDRFKLHVSARDRRWKLYETGKLFDIDNDVLEKSPILAADDSPETAAIRNRLAKVIQSESAKGNEAMLEHQRSINADGANETSAKPNIVWIIPDDMSANFSCYGETAITTPNVDKLATEGVKFTNAYVTAPVCSTCRSAFITGMYQTSIGAHHHRSGRGKEKIRLPENIKLVPKLFQEAGYHTSITGWPVSEGKGKNGKPKFGKTDYNFEWDPSVYDSNNWADRAKDQPFFCQIQTQGGKLRGKNADGWEKIASGAEQALGSRTSTDAVTLPPYYPNHPDIIRDWAAYLDSARMTDVMVGEVIARLEKEGIRDNTLVIFMTDHGISHGRGKQFMYDEGLHVPLVMTGPGIKSGTVRDDVVEHIDIAALSLAAAGITVPEYMQAQDILDANYSVREAVFAARDRCDETVDHMRSVRTKEFKYIRNFLPNRPYLQPNAYKDAKAILIALREYHQAGKLNEAQSLIMSNVRPPEELYDTINDPHEIHNLANDSKYAGKLKELRDRLDVWMKDTNDHGAESGKMYDSDMQVYIDRLKSPKFAPAHLKVVEDNIALMKKWANEGK